MVRREHDKAVLAQLLERDREWALYALADLDDGLFEQCEWWTAGDALALVFHGLDIRPIFLMGPAADLGTVLDGAPLPSGYLNVREEHDGVAATRFRFTARHAMFRMMLDRFSPVAGETVRVGPADLGEIQALYGSGSGAGIAFSPAQLATGVFHGVRANGRLVAVAGAQVVSTTRGVAAVGNVFVRPEARGRGLAQIALSATVAAIRATGIETIGLNVGRDNHAAVHAYEKLGFRAVLSYVEGPAERYR